MSEPNYPPPPPPPSYTPPPPPPGGGMPPGGGYPPGGTVPPGGGAASPNRSLMIVLSYLWLLALIPLIVEKDDREVQWHAKNGLILTGAEVIVYIALWMLGMVTSFVDMGCLMGLTGCVVQPIIGLIVLVVRIVAIVKGVNGERFIIPGLSQYVDRF